MKKYVIAQNYMCFLALLEMIIYELYDSTVVSQFDMAEQFGLTIPPDADISIKNYKISKVQRDFGLHVNEMMLNDMFSKMGLQISAVYFKENPFEYNGIDEYTALSLRKNKYIIYTIGYGYLFKDNEKLDLGHAVLFESAISDSLIKIYDPGPLNPGFKIVNRVDLHEAMLKRSGGIYVISRVKT